MIKKKDAIPILESIELELLSFNVKAAYHIRRAIELIIEENKKLFNLKINKREDWI